MTAMATSNQNFKSISSKLVPFLNTLGVYFVLFLPSEEPSTLAMVVKCLPTASLVVFVLLHGISLQPQYSFSRRIALGLLFSCLGDAFLVWPNLFLPGMAAFGVAQILYISAFQFKPLSLNVGLTIYAISAIALAILRKNLTGVFLIGVPVYAFLLSTMTWRTIARVWLIMGTYYLGQLGIAMSVSEQSLNCRNQGVKKPASLVQ